MDLKEIKSIHDSLLEKKDDQTLEIPNHLPLNMKLVFGERQEVQEKFSAVEATLMKIHLGRLRDTLDDQLKLYDHLK